MFGLCCCREYLTGFHKRKQERRRFGLDMEAFKQKKRLMEARKQRRVEQKEQLKALNIDEKTLVSDDEEEEEEDEEDDSEDDSEAENQDSKSALRGKTVTKVMTFDDEHTQDKFGDVVTVTTSVGDFKSDTEDELSEEEEEADEGGDEEKAPSGKHQYKPKEKQLTMFQRIQLKRRGKALPSKRAKLKEARANRKAMGLHGKGSRKGGKDVSADGDASSVAKALLKKRSFGGGGGKGKKRHKKH